jgi:hypothetical protein
LSYETIIINRGGEAGGDRQELIRIAQGKAVMSGKSGAFLTADFRESFSSNSKPAG